MAKQRKRLTLAQKERALETPEFFDISPDIAQGLFMAYEVDCALEEALGTFERKPYSPEKGDTVYDLVMLDWKFPHEVEDRQHVNDRIADHTKLECNPDIIWLPDKILTTEMQELLECSPTEIGIEDRAAASLERNKGIIRLSQLLQYTWDELMSWTANERDGGIANFGKATVNQIQDCLVRHGFSAPPGTKWINEQDVEEHIAYQNKILFSKS